jgi:hypothetical protein
MLPQYEAVTWFVYKIQSCKFETKNQNRNSSNKCVSTFLDTIS